MKSVQKLEILEPEINEYKEEKHYLTEEEVAIDNVP